MKHFSHLAALLSPVAWSLVYRRRLRQWPNLIRPRTFNEHIGAAMLLERHPDWVHLSDKLEVKKVVAERLGSEWVTPTLWTGRSLPPRAERSWPMPYVLKANNGSSRNLFVKSSVDQEWDAIEAKCALWMRRPYSPAKGEWQYLRIPPRLLVEPMLIGPGGRELDNYRLWCFDGVVQYVQLSTLRDGAWHTAFFYPDWKRAPFAYVWPIDPLSRSPPPCLGAMLDGAAKLAAGLPFARIDLYDVEGRPRFGEVTLTPSAGLGKFFPPEADANMGKLWPVRA
jgi:hypothetical protein